MKPDSSDQCAVRLEVSLSKGELMEAESGEVRFKLTNVKTEPLPMVVAIVGLPGGWRGMNPSDTVACNLDVRAAIPGKYTGPASRAYLYYTPEHKQWVDGFSVEIKPVDESAWKAQQEAAELPATETPAQAPSQHSVAEWLEANHLAEYKTQFANEGYEEMPDTVDITEEELKDMGISKTGHRKKLVRLIAEWKEYHI